MTKDLKVLILGVIIAVPGILIINYTFWGLIPVIVGIGLGLWSLRLQEQRFAREGVFDPPRTDTCGGNIYWNMDDGQFMCSRCFRACPNKVHP